MRTSAEYRNGVRVLVTRSLAGWHTRYRRLLAVADEYYRRGDIAKWASRYGDAKMAGNAIY